MSRESKNGFPSEAVSKEEKAKGGYGLEYARAIWSNHTTNIGAFNTQRERFINNRKYAEGLEDTDKYKARIDLDEDSSHLNLDLTPINRIATIVDNIVGKLINQTFKPQCNPIDSESLTKLDNYRNRLYANLLLAKIAPEIEAKTGVPLIPLGEKVPESKDDIEMHLQLNYKMDASMAMEEAIHYVGINNDREEDREKMIRDLVVCKKAAEYRYYDENFNIIREYVDIADLITPYSKYDDFRNITYVGVLKQYQIWEIALMNPSFTEEDLYKIAEENEGTNKNPSWKYGDSYEGYYRSYGNLRPWVNFNISVLEFFYITSNKDKRIKKKNNKGGFFFNKDSDNYTSKVKPSNVRVERKGDVWRVVGDKGTPMTISLKKAKTKKEAQIHFAELKTKKREENTEVITKSAKYRYEGKWIPGTDWIWDYKMSENIERDRVNGSYSPEVELPITIIQPNIYDQENKSLVERMMPFEDAINLANLKFQQMLIKAVPPGIAFDVSGIEGMINEIGKGVDPIAFMKGFQETGSFAYSSVRDDGSIINGNVVENLPNGIGDFRAFIETQNHYMQLMNDVIGFNSAVDASTPNADALVGVQKMAVNATNDSLRTLYRGYIKLETKSTKRVMLMIQDSMRSNEKAFTMALGAQAVKTIAYGRKIAFNQFAIELELAPDEEEKMQIEGLIQLGLQNLTLNVSDAIRIRQELKGSAKLAAQLLVLLESKNRKDKQEESMMLQEQNAQVQQQSAQVAEQAKMQSALAIEQAKQQTQAQDYELKDGYETRQHSRNMELQSLKNQGIEVVAAIGAEGKENVQEVINQGKVVVETIKKDTKEAKTPEEKKKS